MYIHLKKRMESVRFSTHEKFGSKEEVTKRVVFTLHTPEEAGTKSIYFPLRAHGLF